MDDDLDDDLDDGLDYTSRKVARTAFWDITSSIVDTQSAITVLAITMTLEICGLAALVFAGDKVTRDLAKTDVNFQFYVWAAAFVVGFLNGFAIYVLIANKWPHRDSGLNTWLVGTGTGLINLFLFFLLTPSFSR